MSDTAKELYIAIDPDERILATDVKWPNLFKYLSTLDINLEGTVVYHCKPIYEGKCTFEWDPT